MRVRAKRSCKHQSWLVSLTVAVFKLTYIVGYTLVKFIIELFRVPQRARVNTSAQQIKNQNQDCNSIANQDVVDALDQEIEVLRNFREDLLVQSQRTNVSATKAAKLQKQAAATYTRMMKLNEQALKRRAKLDDIEEDK